MSIKERLIISEQLKENKVNVEDFEDLKYDFDEMKEMIGDIQCRYLSKNFLNCFKFYLTQEEKNLIQEGTISKGKAISKRIGVIFPNANKKKLAMLQTLLESSSQLLDDGNYFAHTLLLENFTKDIEDYKAKKKLPYMG